MRLLRPLAGLALAVLTLLGALPAQATSPGLASVLRGGSAAPLIQIDPVGWRAKARNPHTYAPDTASETVAFTRPGFDTTAAPALYVDKLTITKRTRQPYPLQASLTSRDVALSDYVYASDFSPGVLNLSTETSPKPVCNWVTPARALLNNTLGAGTWPVEVVCFHRNARLGQEVAAVVFSIADTHSHTTSVTVGGATISNRNLDRHAVIVFALPSTSLSSLTDGDTLTVNFKAYPWIGTDPTSVFDSSVSALAREASPRYFLKNTALAASPWYAYVASTGNDGTCVVSQTAATAAASPCLTVGGAAVKANTAAGKLDGVIFRIVDTVTGGSAASATVDQVACPTVTRAPATARAAAIVKFGASSLRPKMGSVTSPDTESCIRFTDLSLLRDGSGTLLGESAAKMQVQLDDVDFDDASNATAILSSSHLYVTGMTATNIAVSGVINAATTPEIRLVRGLSADLANAAWEGWLAVGNDIKRAGNVNAGTRTANRTIVAYNTFWNVTSTTDFWGAGQSENIPDGAAFVQNVVETAHTTASTVSSGITRDSATGNVTHVILHYNTYTGFFNVGRQNFFYDEGATERTSKLQSCRGDIDSQLNTKGDWFVTDGTRLGNWGYLYGVGCQGIVTQWLDAGGGGLGSSFAQNYPGLGANIGASATVRNDPSFTSYQGTTNTGSTPVVGTGNGNYHVASGSIAKGVVAQAMLGWDLDGTARQLTGDTAGAYTLTPPTVSYLVVAGGGGSGGAGPGGLPSGGGGAGGMLTGTTTLASATYTITVGAGGAGGAASANGSNGGNSSLGAIATATGGGGSGSGNSGTGQAGGSGGGSGRSGTSFGAGTGGQGSNGGAATSQGAGGGGGAGAVGADAVTFTGGNGGAGLASSISGASVTYAGGGAGDGNSFNGSGGAGGGGGNNTAGTANTGGGGGGVISNGASGAAGGSGVVVISFTTGSFSPTSTGSPTVTTSGGNTIYTYTGSGTFVVP